MFARISLGTTALLAAVLLVGCGSGGGSATGTRLAIERTGAATGSRAVKTRHTADGTVLIITLASGKTVEIDEARFGVSEFDFDDLAQSTEAEGSEADDDDVEIHGPFVADLVDRVLRNPDGTEASSIFAAFPAGTVFEEVEFDIDPGPGVDPDARETVSFYIHGTLRDVGGAVLMSFRLTSRENEELEFEDETNGVTVEAGTNIMAVLFAMADWFDGVDLTTANTSAGNVDVNGDVLFDDTHNESIRNAIVDNIRNGIDLIEDDDGDGVEDDD